MSENSSRLDLPNSKEKLGHAKNALDNNTGRRNQTDEFPTSSLIRPKPIRLGSMSLFDLIGRGFSLDRPPMEGGEKDKEVPGITITPEPPDERNDSNRTDEGSGSILLDNHCNYDLYAESLRKDGARHPEPKEEEEMYDWNDDFSTLSVQVEELLATSSSDNAATTGNRHPLHLIVAEPQSNRIVRPKALRPMDFAGDGGRTLQNSFGSIYFYPL
jgi:hypothetical protein